jgi:hypothetical protein
MELFDREWFEQLVNLHAVLLGDPVLTFGQ